MLSSLFHSFHSTIGGHGRLDIYHLFGIFSFPGMDTSGVNAIGDL